VRLRKVIFRVFLEIDFFSSLEKFRPPKVIFRVDCQTLDITGFISGHYTKTLEGEQGGSPRGGRAIAHLLVREAKTTFDDFKSLTRQHGCYKLKMLLLSPLR
jgi:hypothetical protein